MTQILQAAWFRILLLFILHHWHGASQRIKCRTVPYSPIVHNLRFWDLVAFHKMLPPCLLSGRAWKLSNSLLKGEDGFQACDVMIGRGPYHCLSCACSKVHTCIGEDYRALLQVWCHCQQEGPSRTWDTVPNRISCKPSRSRRHKQDPELSYRRRG